MPERRLTPRVLALTLLAAVLAAVPARAQQAPPCPAPAAASPSESGLPPGLRAGEHEAVVDGVRLWYRVAGSAPAGAAPVVFLHGGPGYNSHSFSVLAGPRLECGLRMVYFDQRGSGRSQRPESGEYSIERLVEDVEGLRRALGVPKVALLGHSFGGTLALEYAARYPERVSRLVFVSGLYDAPLQCRLRRERLAAAHPEAVARALADSAGAAAIAESDCNAEFRALRGAAREA
ncbi:MAG TPA: alpha/beta hydrolase, partial [Longimicrobiaceae bacterium]